MRGKWIALSIALIMIIGLCVSTALASDKSNDVRFTGRQYIEYFSGRGGGKNYMYTATEIEAPAAGKCVVITANSERTVAVYCNTGGAR